MFQNDHLHPQSRARQVQPRTQPHLPLGSVCLCFCTRSHADTGRKVCAEDPDHHLLSRDQLKTWLAQVFRGRTTAGKSFGAHPPNFSDELQRQNTLEPLELAAPALMTDDSNPSTLLSLQDVSPASRTIDSNAEPRADPRISTFGCFTSHPPASVQLIDDDQFAVAVANPIERQGVLPGTRAGLRPPAAICWTRRRPEPWFLQSAKIPCMSTRSPGTNELRGDVEDGEVISPHASYNSRDLVTPL